MKEKTTFSKDQYDLAYPKGIENHYWQKARSKIIYNEIVKANIDKQTFLEIGCGKGIIVKFLRKFGINVKGVELSLDMEINDSIKNFVYSGTNAFDLSPDFRRSIDCILLLDVIEHIEEPIQFIREIIDKFPHAKYLLITVPARQEIWSNYDSFYGHFKRYELNDFKNLRKALNCTDIKTGHFFNSLYLVARILMKTKKERECKITAPKGIMKWVHKLVYFYLMIEYKIFPSKLYGSSIISVMKRKNKDYAIKKQKTN